MPASGDVVDLELGTPEGREAGFSHKAVLVTAQRILDAIFALLQLPEQEDKYGSVLVVVPPSLLAVKWIVSKYW